MRRLTAAIILVCAVLALSGLAVRPAAAQDGSTVYVVQPGDNLFRISQRFGVTMDAIARANNIVNPNLIMVGQKLTIPVAGTGGALQSPAPTTAPTNTPSEPPTITPTLTILLPAITPTFTPTEPPPPGTDAATAAPTAAATARATAAPVPGTTPATYTVQVGDNLYRIAVRFRTTIQTLQQLNALPNVNSIFVGQVLRLPATAPAAPITSASSPATAAPTSGTGGVAPPPVVNSASNVGFSFGAVVELQGEDAARLMGAVNDLGMGWVKQYISWKQYEPSQNNIDFEKLDGLINALTASGQKVLLTVSKAPDWARAITTEDGPPADYNNYAAFVGRLAERYKSRIQAYEIWAEPNIRREWNGRPLSGASYVEMLRLAYNAIKRADSAALVVTAGLAPTGFNDGVNAINDRIFLRQAYTAGLASYSDAIGARPFGWANPPDSTCCAASPGVPDWFNDRTFYFRDTLADYRQIMVQNGDGGTFIWVTAFGWGSVEGLPADTPISAGLNFVKFTSLAQQAQYIARAYDIGRALGYVGPMFVYRLNSPASLTPASSDFELRFYALLNPTDGSPRPVFDLLKAARK